MEPKLIADRYLGDGVYASFDGYRIWLDTGPRPHCDGCTVATRAQTPNPERIALDPHVLAALVQYDKDMRAAIEAAEEPRP